METLTYIYKPRLMGMALGFVFFGACAAFGAEQAHTNVSGLIIDGFIRLDPAGATTFWWGMCGLAALMALGGLFGIYRALTSQQKLVLDAAGVRTTGAMFGDKTVAYRDITGLNMWEYKGQRMLIVRHAGGKINVARSMLPTHEIFDKVCRVLQERVTAARGGM